MSFAEAHSPSTRSAVGTANGSTSRPCRALFVDCHAFEGGVRSTLYCKISMNASTSELVRLGEQSTLLHHSTYPLPLQGDMLASSATECLRAARLLRLDGLVEPELNAGQRAGTSSKLKLREQDGALQLHVDTVGSLPSPPVSESGRSPSPTISAEKLEWILVLRLETRFTGLQAPHYPSSITIPVPVCLRNSLAITLPAEESWNVAVQPSLQAHSAARDIGASTVSGNFAATSSLTMRWTPRGVDHHVIVPQSRLTVDWMIQGEGRARAQVNVEGKLRYRGLTERAYIDVRIDHLPVDETRSVKILSVEGTGVVSWTLDKPAEREAKRTRSTSTPSVASTSSISKTARIAPEPTSEQTTPTLRKRRSKRLSSLPPRPPSFSNLFEQTMPLAPKLDLVSVPRSQEPSLLRETPPPEEDSLADVTFEAAATADSTRPVISDQPGTPSSTASRPLDGSSSPDAPDADDILAEEFPKLVSEERLSDHTIVSIQLDVLKLLQAEQATFAITFVADCHVQHVQQSQAESYDGRLSLPAFTMINAESEASVISVAARDGSTVELAPAEPMLKEVDKEADSPLPASHGRAKWRHERDNDAAPSPARLVQVEVVRPQNSRRSSSARLDSPRDIDDSPSPATRLLRRQVSAQLLRSASTLSLRSRPSISSVGLSSTEHVPQQAATVDLVKLKITPVPPTEPLQPWQIFTHLTFDRPFTGAFDLPLGEDQQVDVLDSWDAGGDATEIDAKTCSKEGDTPKRLRIETKDSPASIRVRGEHSRDESRDSSSDGVHEMVYCVSTPEKNGTLEIGDVLPRLQSKVAAMEVEIVPVEGYELKTERQLFDSTSSKDGDGATTFTRFEIPASETTRLCVQLQVMDPPASPPSEPAHEKPPLMPPSPLPEEARTESMEDEEEEKVQNTADTGAEAAHSFDPVARSESAPEPEPESEPAQHSSSVELKSIEEPLLLQSDTKAAAVSEASPPPPPTHIEIPRIIKQTPRQTNAIPVTPATTYAQLMRWLPIILVLLTLAVAQLSSTDGPLNDLIVGRPWPNTDDLSHTTLKPIPPMESGQETALTTTAAQTARAATTTIAPLPSPIHITPIIPVVVPSQAAPPSFLDDFGEPTSDTTVVGPASTPTSSTGIGEALENWTVRLRQLSEEFVKGLLWLLGIW